jgi:aldehyde:ferredoxin oxidoreductase
MVGSAGSGFYGWTGKVVRADLSSEQITVEPSDKYLKFIGGRGLIAKVIWDEVPAGTKAFDPENRLVFAAGPLTGTNSPMNGRWSIGSLSPQHPNEYPSHSSVGGHWGAELKFAGYDAIIIQGAAKQPVHIIIIDNYLEIRNAGNLWGMNAIAAEKKLINDFANEQIIPKNINTEEKTVAGKYSLKLMRHVVIGPAGENKTRFATILSDLGHSAGQNGFGAVMGSKNLKAISVRGTGSVPVAKPKDMVELAFRARKLIRAQAKPVVPPYAGPGGIYGGDPSTLVGYMKRLHACFSYVSCSKHVL